MKAWQIAVGLAVLASGLTSCMPGQDPDGAGAASCASGTFLGEINGASATARVVYEPFPDYTGMSTEIVSGPFTYTFNADIIGDRGWGDIVEQPGGATWRVQIDLIPSGFLLTSNPFTDMPTTYTFRCN